MAQLVQNPLAARRSDLMKRIRTLMVPRVVFKWMHGDRRLVTYRKKIKAVVLQIIEQRDVYELRNGAVLRLIRAIDAWPPQAEPRVEKILVDMARESWEKGSPRGWLDYTHWKHLRASDREVADLHEAHVETLYKLFEARPKTAETLKIFSQFGVDLFRGGLDAPAAKLYEEMLSWQIENERHQSDTALYRANAYLILALIKRRSGDVPSALEFAQRALQEGEMGKSWT